MISLDSAIGRDSPRPGKNKTSMNEDIFGHDSLSDMASTPNAAELNAALPQLMSTSTTAFDAFDDLDINQTNFSELDEEEQDIAHIILSDPSLLGLDCLVGAGPPKNRIAGNGNGQRVDDRGTGTGPASLATTPGSSSIASTPFTNSSGQHNPTFKFQHTVSAQTSVSRQSSTFDGGAVRVGYGSGTSVETGNNSGSGYAHRPMPRSVPAGTRRVGEVDENTVVQRGMLSSEGLRVGSPPKPVVRPPTMRKACDLCHQAKQKCSGERPKCERCRAGNWPCHYAVRQRRRAPGSSKPAPASTQQSFVASGGLKALSNQRSTPLGQSSLQRPVPPQRTFPPSTINSGNTTMSAQSSMPNGVQKPTSKPILPPPPPLVNQRPTNPITPITTNGISGDIAKPLDTPTHATTQPRIRSIAGPIKAGMPNFGQFSANAFLAKKFPGLMPGASRPIVSPGQLPYMSKASASAGLSEQSVSNSHQSPASPSLSAKAAPKRPTKKRKTKNGGGVASAEAENDLNVMDGFGYLYGFQDTNSSDPGLGNQGSSYMYHGPVGWAPSRSAVQFGGSTPRDPHGSDKWHTNVGVEEEPAMRAEDYLQVIHEDGLLADLDLDSHLSTLAPSSQDDSSRIDHSPSRTQVSDDVLQDVASILDPQFTDRNGVSTTIKTETASHTDVEDNGESVYSFAVPANGDDGVLRLLGSEFTYPSYGDASNSTGGNAQPAHAGKTEIIASGDGSMTDLDAALFGDGDHVSAANLAAFSDQIFSTTFSSHDSQQSEASSVYHDSGEGQLPDFMMEDLTDFAAWSAQAEQPFAASEASSRFGTNPNQSPVNAFQNPFASGLSVDLSGLDELIQLNAKNEEEQYALDLASMFPDPEDNGQQSNPPGTTEDVIMDGGLMNIEELEQALKQHTEMTSTPVAGAQDFLPSPEVLPKTEAPDTPLSSAQATLPVVDAADEAQPQGQPTPLSHTDTTTPGFTHPSKSRCQHEVDISQTVRALSRLYLPTLALGQLMPHLTRALEILVSLHVCTLCSVNPTQTIPQLALLSRTCSILLRPHPLTPSPLPLTIAGGRTTFTGLAPEVEVHIIDILWANWRSHSIQKVFTDIERRVHEHAEECARKRQEKQQDASRSVEGERTNDGPTPEELRCDMMALALKRFRAKVR